ncbi:glycoside hydrolase family 108 protein [Tenacibaculum finnmarkense]|uniref:glycoside hydrolase family 108 protein n=1 Tax=Tenacibaculum finnmarkense TaxID=2781243 RepID=UPI00187B24FF|nr:glycosyl hydrolase 108 family protein [Tenacibaculum finnmarkense]MBE7648329.1 hypothetical protein [Tenacibaculum finnmarkense genomovar ulcerans]
MANYPTFQKKIQRAEGGYQKLKTDSGNYNSLKQLVGTNFGVSAKVYERNIGRPPSIADMKNITQQIAHTIFKNQFWDSINADKITSQAIAETFADHAINASPKRATIIMQRTLNNAFNKKLLIDGIAGAKTITAINSVDAKELFNAYSQARKSYYSSLRDCKHFCNVWHRRVDELATDHNISINKPVHGLSKKKA